MKLIKHKMEERSKKKPKLDANGYDSAFIDARNNPTEGRYTLRPVIALGVGDIFDMGTYQKLQKDVPEVWASQHKTNPRASTTLVSDAFALYDTCTDFSLELEREISRKRHPKTIAF